MGCIGGLNAVRDIRVLGGQPGSRWKKRKKQFSFSLVLILVNPVMGAAADSTSLEEAVSSSSGNLCLMCFRICCGTVFAGV